MSIGVGTIRGRLAVVLVLAASASKEGPGPLVTAFAGRSGAAALPVLVTIVPGSMTDEQIVAVT